jgi:DNA polymerase III subunit delta'
MLYPWLQSTWSMFLNMFQSNKLPHALLVSGSEGLGQHKLTLAMIQLILCEHPNESACNKCSACLLFLSGNHPDIMTIGEEGQSQAIKVDTIREIGGFLLKTSQQSSNKVLVIYQAESMNRNASNALLKLLEEPPESSYLILVTCHKGKLLPTIRSRCHELNIKPPDFNWTRDWLKDKGYGQEGVDIAAMIATPQPLSIIKFLDDDGLKRYRVFEQLILNLNSQNYISTSASLDNNDIALLLVCMKRWLKEIIQAKILNDDSILTGGTVVSSLQSTPRKINLLFKLYDFLQDAEVNIINEDNINKILLIENVCIRWAACFPN